MVEPGGVTEGKEEEEGGGDSDDLSGRGDGRGYESVMTCIHQAEQVFSPWGEVTSWIQEKALILHLISLIHPLPVVWGRCRWRE